MAAPNGTSAKDLSEALKEVTLEDLALRLDRIEAMMTAPRDPIKEIREIAAAGSVTVRELRARGYTALQVMVAEVGEELSGLPALLAGGYSWSSLVDAVGTQSAAAAACFDANIPMQSLTEAGAPVGVLTRPSLAKEMSLPRVLELLAAKAPVTSLLEAGTPPRLLAQAGVKGPTLIDAGVPAKVLVEECGFPVGAFVIPVGTRISFPRAFSNWEQCRVSACVAPDEYDIAYSHYGRKESLTMKTKDMVTYGVKFL